MTLCLLLSFVVWKGTGMVKSYISRNDEDIPIFVESPEDDDLRNTVLYYKDDKGYLVPVMRKIPWPEGRGIAKASLRALVNNVANREEMESLGLMPILPAETKIIGMDIVDGLCIVELTAEAVNHSTQEEEIAMVNGIVYTLTEFPTIEYVELRIEGKPYQVAGSNMMCRGDINYFGDASNENRVVVYYQGTVNGMENYFVPVTKEVSNAKATVIDAVESLIEGPVDGSGLFTSLPQNLYVENVDVIDGVAYVNFNKEIKEIDDKVVAEDMIKALALTISEFYKDEVLVEHVSILADGKEIDLAKLTKKEPVVVPTFANEYQ